ncbi:hypothetical protein BLSTO_01787 [Blastocystis sp. subtype 1]
MNDSYATILSDMLQYILIRELPRNNLAIHFSQQFLSMFSYAFRTALTNRDMKPLFMRVTNNSFLQERQNVNADMPFNYRYYKGTRGFTFQEHLLLEFWNSFLSPSVRIVLIRDYFQLSACSSEVSSYVLGVLESNKWQLQCLYNTPVLVFFNQVMIQEFRQLMGYIERMRKVMGGFFLPTASYPMVESEMIYRHLQEGAMDMDGGYRPVPSRDHTFKGISLSERENPALMEKLGSDLLEFTEWCQSRSSWRRRGYLVVVNELTRIIHKEFAQAQIELYGSSRTGLMIPSSDVDIVIVDNTSLLEKVASLLTDIPWIREVRHIKGSVQVVKVVIDQTVMSNTTLIPTLENDVLVVDITQISTSHTGITTAVTIKNKLNRSWELTPLILFVKELLYENQLNSAYEGGMNSVAAVIVAMAYFHDWKESGNHQTDEEYNVSYKKKKQELGNLIVGLLYYLGFEFNYVKMGVSADLGFFNREALAKQITSSALFETDPIVVIDPMNPSNNLGKSCFNVYRIKTLFRNTYIQLISNIDQECENPLLKLLGVTEQCQAFLDHYCR